MTSDGYTVPSARQILWDAGVDEDIIDGALHVHAHELADKIRKAGGWTQAQSEHLRGMGTAADLIEEDG